MPVDAGDGGADVTESAKELRVDARFDWVVAGAVGGSMVLFTRLVIGGLVGEVIGVGVDILAELGIALGFFVTVACVGDVRAVVWTGTLINIDVTIPTRVDLVAALIADTITGFVPGIGVDVLAGLDAKTDLAFPDARASLEGSLRCC